MKKAILHKSFNSAKCKTTLKLAVSRMKLLKNKKEAQIKQLRREVAHLLESGQNQTARIRVEHVVREEKTLAAYDLIEIYCELIVARLPIIESQKNCPIDLKEAIASVIFASPRCVDVPELMDVRKHFSAKYGKDFVSAAIEIRPDCGVSRLLVEKLSAKAPDGPTKIRILSAIAEEHNIQWDPKLFGETEMRPPEDLLNGPSTFEQAGKINTQEPPNSVDKGPPNFGDPSKHYEKHDAPVNSYSSYSGSSSHSQTFSSTAADPNRAMPSVNPHADPRPFGSESETKEFGHSALGQSGHSSGRQGWNMEFTDATAAAQAAAESAELASLAARAAAELSSQGRVSRQHSTESNKASIFRSKDEGLQNNASSRLQGENLDQVPVNNTSGRGNSGMHLGQSSENEQDDLAGLAERFYNLKKSNQPSRSASSKSSNSSMDDRPQVTDFQMADRHSRKTSYELEKSELLDEASMKKDSSEPEAEFSSEMRDGLRSETFGYFEEASIQKQSSNISSHSHPQIPSDDHNFVSSFGQQKFTDGVVKEHFIFNDGNDRRDSNDTNSYDNPSVVFDDYGSDDDELKFDVRNEHYGQDSSSYYFSEGRKSSPHLSASTSAKSPWLSMQGSLGKSSLQLPFTSDLQSTSLLSEGLTSNAVPSRADDLLPVTFDASDGPSSESEGELDESKLTASKQAGSSPRDDITYSSNPEITQNVNSHLIGSSLAEKESMGLNRKTWKQSSTVDSDVEVHSKRNQGIEIRDENGNDGKFGYGQLHTDRTSHVLAKSQSNSSRSNESSSTVKEDDKKFQSPDTMGDSTPIKDSSSGSGQELNFGTLTGGLRNKGYRHPPYHRNAPNTSSQVERNNSTRIEQHSSSFKVDIGSGTNDQEPYEQLVHQKVNKKAISGTPVPYSDSDRGSDEGFPQRTLASGQDPDIRQAGSEGNKKSSSRSYFDSDSSDSEDDLPKETPTSKRSGPGFSRRTKTSERNSSLKPRVPFNSSVPKDYVVEQQSSPMSSYSTETKVKPPSESKNSYHQQGFEQSRSPEQASSKLVSQYKRSVHEDSSSKSNYPNYSRQDQPSQLGKSELRKSAELSRPIPESKRSSRDENLKSSTRELPSNSPPRTVASVGAESTKASSSSAKPPSREDSIGKASHVHPKLPDYDTLTAHLLSLRQNRQ